MRLIRCAAENLQGLQNLVLEDYYGEDLPHYAILSHTWGKDEVLFTDVQNGTAISRKGYPKLQRAMSQARLDGLDYIWIDTCCIDKSSSAELSEAINSMFNWYQHAVVCYVYLEDLSTGQDSFPDCRWFTRGWCLQELIAPKFVNFYTAEWAYFGTKSNLCEEIAQITAIDIGILEMTKSLESMSVAQRMSWAAKRKTTRTEDLAYCLMGIFSVNMPLLYGEGEKAFIRLQEEIIKGSDDHTIFAWTTRELDDEQGHGLLADAPSAFEFSNRIVRYHSEFEAEPFHITNRGLKIRLPLLPLLPSIPSTAEEDPPTFLAALECPIPWQGFTGNVAIALRRMSGSGDQEYERVMCSILLDTRLLGRYETLYVRQYHSMRSWDIICPVHYFQFLHPWRETEISVLEVRALRRVQLQNATGGDTLPPQLREAFVIHKEAGRLSAALLLCARHSNTKFVLMLGSQTDLDAGYDVITWPRDDKLDSLALLEHQFKPRNIARSKLMIDITGIRLLTQCRILYRNKVYGISLRVLFGGLLGHSDARAPPHDLP